MTICIAVYGEKFQSRAVTLTLVRQCPIDRVCLAEKSTRKDEKTQRASEISGFVSPSSLYQYKVMPFKMKNAPATFQRMVYKLVGGISGCEGYIDDVVFKSNNWSDHVCQIKHFFQKM